MRGPTLPSAAVAADRLAQRAKCRALRRRPLLPSHPPRRPDPTKPAAPCPLASSFPTTEPIDTLSPTLTTISAILPAAGEGTSMLALSDSSVTIGCSASTVSPAFTRISMTGTSLKSPMSGIVMSIVAAFAGAGRRIWREAPTFPMWMTPARPALPVRPWSSPALAPPTWRERLRPLRPPRIRSARSASPSTLCRRPWPQPLRPCPPPARARPSRPCQNSSVDQRLLRRDDIAGLHQHLDDRHVIEVADIGNLHVDFRHRRSLLSGQLVLGATSASRRIRPVRIDAVFRDRLGDTPGGQQLVFR